MRSPVKAVRWTRRKLLMVYQLAFSGDSIDVTDKDDPRLDDIAVEMKRVIQAKTLDEAKDVIEWWDAWEHGQLTKAVKRIQKYAEKMK